MGALVYLNGWIGDFSEAKVSVNDRGYVFGDGVYEVIRVYHGQFMGMEEHMQRLLTSLEAVEIEYPWSKQELIQLTKDLVIKSELQEAFVYLQITRGIAPRNHIYQPGMQPSLMITVQEVPPKDLDDYQKGIKIVSRQEFRWQMCQIKSISLQAAVLAKNTAHKQGAKEVVFYLPDGTVTECGSSNIFMVKNENLYTHPADHHILSGITRLTILDLAAQMNIPIRIEPFSLNDLLQANEVFLSGSVAEITPVVKVDDQIIGSGTPGNLTKKLMSAYTELAQSL